MVQNFFPTLELHVCFEICKNIKSKKLGKGDFDLLIPFPMMRQEKIIRYINWKDHVQEFKEQTVFQFKDALFFIVYFTEW